MGRKKSGKVKEEPNAIAAKIKTPEEKIIDEIEEDDFLNSGEWEEKLPPKEDEIKALVQESIAPVEDAGLSNVFKDNAAAKAIIASSGKIQLGFHPITNEPVYA